MTWEESTREHVQAGQIRLIESIESVVLQRVGSRLRELTLDEVDEKLVIRGLAISYHAKQLAGQEVMALTTQPILGNQIEVRA